MDSKELALALDFKKAPKEIQEAAVKVGEASVRLNKAINQKAKWIAEETEATKAFRLANAELDKLIAAWTPDSLKPEPVQSPAVTETKAVK